MKLTAQFDEVFFKRKSTIDILTVENSKNDWQLIAIPIEDVVRISAKTMVEYRTPFFRKFLLFAIIFFDDIFAFV